MIKIHTVSGALVRALSTDAVAGQAQVPWDGTDERGDRVANGAYTYHVEAQGVSERHRDPLPRPTRGPALACSLHGRPGGHFFRPRRNLRGIMRWMLHSPIPVRRLT